MANPTNPFNWQMPQSTDLVTDLPADFETFGQAVATSMADLLGGTTGQVLSKASNTDMDFTWVAQDDSNAIQNAIVDAKGDLIAASAADTPARLAVGTNGQVLTADSTAATGLAWTTISTGGTWTSFTPTWTNLSVGNGTVTAKYLKVGGLVNFRIKLVWGSTTSISGRVSINYPVAPIDASAAETPIINVQFEDYGNAPTIGAILNASANTTSFSIFAVNTSGTYAGVSDLSSTAPFTWVTNDRIYVSGSYEVTP